MTKAGFELTWSETYDRIIIKEYNDSGEVILEFSLKPPRHADLYYTLKDWFGD